MSNKKKSALNASLLAAMMASSNPDIFKSNIRGEAEMLQAMLDEKQRQKDQDEVRRLKQGQQKFFYGEGEDDFVWARNRKNAERKAKNKGYTLL